MLVLVLLVLVLLSNCSPLLERLSRPVDVQPEVSRVAHRLPEHQQVEAAVEQRADVVSPQGQRALQRPGSCHAVPAAGKPAETLLAVGTPAVVVVRILSPTRPSMAAGTGTVTIRRRCPLGGRAAGVVSRLRWPMRRRR